MKDKVVFEANVPVEVCLAHAEGKEIGDQREQQVMFDLADGRLMFVPRSVRDELRKLEIKPGERFQICKREVNDDGEACIEWTVSRLALPSSAVQLIQSAKDGSAAPARPASESNNGASGYAGNAPPLRKNGQAKLSYIMQMALQGALDASKAVEAMFIESRKRAW